MSPNFWIFNSSVCGILKNLFININVSENEDFQALRINDDFLRYRTGLYQGCLAIFVTGEAANGALSVITIKNGNSVMIGFVSCDMGMVALERPFYHMGHLETEIFDEDEVEILGKVVGYCEPDPDEKGKFEIKMMKIRPETDEADEDISPLTFLPFPRH
jgi:hypothetical protein